MMIEVRVRLEVSADGGTDRYAEDVLVRSVLAAVRDAVKRQEMDGFNHELENEVALAAVGFTAAAVREATDGR